MQAEKVNADVTDAPETAKARWEEPRIEIEYALVAQAQDPNPLDPFVAPLGIS
jgi:hypothetical protein